MENLALSLSDDWVISSVRKIIRISFLSPFENVCVQKSIVWNGEAETVKLFIHNKEVPGSSFLWYSIRDMHPWDIDSVSDHLSKLAYLLKNSNICQGVILYSPVWNEAVQRGEGKIEEEFYQEAACLRDLNCCLVLPGSTICQFCRDRTLLLKHRNWRLHQEKEKDKLKVNIKYITGDEAKERLKISQEEKKKLYRKLYKLKERIKKFIEKKTVPVSAEFGQDIAKVFQDNHHLMTPVQKLFWAEQMKALSTQNNPRQMRWNPFMIRLALHIQMISSSAYEYMQLFLRLPSQRTLYDFTHYVDAKEGIQEVTMAEMQKKLYENYDLGERHSTFFNLIFDEVDVKEDIVVNRRTGEIIG